MRKSTAVLNTFQEIQQNKSSYQDGDQSDNDFQIIKRKKVQIVQEMNEDLISQDSEVRSHEDKDYPDYMKETFKTSESINESIEDFQIFGSQLKHPIYFQMPNNFYKMFKLINLKTALLFLIIKNNHKMGRTIITNKKEYYYKKF